MDKLSRRTFVAAMLAAGSTPAFGARARRINPREARLYAAVKGEPFRIPAVNLSRINPIFLRTTVAYRTIEAPGTIIVDPAAHFLYRVEPGGMATRYGVGVGRQGFGWSGVAMVHDKQKWPDWYPPETMLERQPDLRRELTRLPSGIGIPGGPHNPLGARALYLWQGNMDTLYRIHGTFEPWLIGHSVSSGCIRMINQDAIDLYNKTPIGTKVVVLATQPRRRFPDTEELVNHPSWIFPSFRRGSLW